MQLDGKDLYIRVDCDSYELNNNFKKNQFYIHCDENTFHWKFIYQDWNISNRDMALKEIKDHKIMKVEHMTTPLLRLVYGIT